MITLSSKEKIMLENHLNSIIGNPTSFDNQKSIMGDDGFCLWCEEWELIEMLKYLFNGKEVYDRDPPPNRLKKSTVWSKEAIEQKVIQDLDAMDSVEQIITYFNMRRNKFNEST